MAAQTYDNCRRHHRFHPSTSRPFPDIMRTQVAT